MLIDTHAHLFWDSYKEDFDEVIDRALQANITGAINIGVDVETSQKALRQAQGKLQQIPENFTIYSSIGIHPHEAVKYFNNPDVSIHSDIGRVAKIYWENILTPIESGSKVIGVGECGLDYLFSSNDLHSTATLSPARTKELQRKLFQAQIDLAKKLDLPLLVHCRDDRSQDSENSEAWDEVIEMTKNHFGIYHCYSGLSPTTNYALQTTNFLFSFAGNITYPKNEYLREAVKLIPIDRIVVETDCPFLPPQANRGKRNEPSYITETVQTIADLKGLPIDEVIKAIYQNTISILFPSKP